MRGHLDVIAMRQAGSKPSFVWLSDFADSTLDGVTVRVAGDTPELLDLRFLVGLVVIVESPDAVRADRFVAAVQATAKRTIASTFDNGRVVRVVDSQDTMTWPK